MATTSIAQAVEPTGIAESGTRKTCGWTSAFAAAASAAFACWTTHRPLAAART
jgi:hypothetical protein